MAEDVVGWSPPVSVEPVEFPLAVPLAEGADVEDDSTKEGWVPVASEARLDGRLWGCNSLGQPHCCLLCCDSTTGKHHSQLVQ